ncbi:DUF4932 domain-containing protein [Parapedobacter indicus]|uniref:DUF4932 domain-containing protein n=1 Tax=Parapedobacter indicus TaxID=1477437 RepID=A0A1I3DQF9_9SPHI|nr:DUF4932 domain-containing protein [Parapedobacter indicus]PPL04790.1 uncharacterized protein DUF4932 [Parapedobacter indicus]SFH88789.1 protein of unknown function [Parapedobacter indicus]
MAIHINRRRNRPAHDRLFANIRIRNRVLTSMIILYLVLIGMTIRAQRSITLSKKVTVSCHPNIETYFIAERLAVQQIGFMVFTRQDSLYWHQPLVYAAYEKFKPFQRSPCVQRIAALITIIRDNLHDNAPVLQYLLHLERFPEKGEAVPFRDSSIFASPEHRDLLRVTKELSDSLRSFYQMARVGDFLHSHWQFYQGALREVVKDMNTKAFDAMERYYGESFADYRIYLMPTMPIPYGPDNYRAFGPTLHWPQGRISAMVMSSSVPLAPGKSPDSYTHYGFDNPTVTRFLTIHEIGHSFVNPHVEAFQTTINKDTVLFTPKLRKVMEGSYVGCWYTCVIEHLVRLGEIRTAMAMGNRAEADRLRKMHTEEFHFVLLPLLEQKIAEYETQREQYPDFNNFLPQLLKVFHDLTPEQVDSLLKSEK